MIQRKQTLYLLASGLLMLLLPFVTSIEMISETILYEMNTMGVYLVPPVQGGTETLVQATWGLFLLNVAIILLSILPIFLFKKRVLQMRLTVFNILLKVGFLALGYFYLYRFMEVNHLSHCSVNVWVAIPIICIIMDYLAHRAIAIDERLIQYLNSGRLR